MSDFGLARPTTGVGQMYVKSNRVSNFPVYFKMPVFPIQQRFILHENLPARRTNTGLSEYNATLTWPTILKQYFDNTIDMN